MWIGGAFGSANDVTAFRIETGDARPSLQQMTYRSAEA
uniref:Uncharacterized protein n=1 Tax=Rhizobium meliloti TaxID=382 RepID=I2E227_RHIML|nr:short hypothetical protein [Sinorhizobium meliloti]